MVSVRENKLRSKSVDDVETWQRNVSTPGADARVADVEH